MSVEEDQLRKLDDIHKELKKIAGSTQDRGKGLFGDTKEASADLSSNLFSLAKTATPMGRAFTAITKAAGGVLSVFAGIAGFAWHQLRKYLEETTQSYRTILEVGQTLSGSMVNLNIAAAQANMSVRDFADLVRRAGGAMAYLGADVFAELSSSIRQASFRFGDFGLTTEEINEIFAEQIETRRLMGIREQIDAVTAQQNFIELNQNMLALAAATGKTRSELLKVAEQTKRDDFNIRAAMRALGTLPEEARQSYSRAIEFFSATMGETGRGVSAAIAGALLDDPVSMYNVLKDTFGRFGPAIAGEIQTLSRHIRDGSLTTEQANIQAQRIVQATGMSEQQLRIIANSTSAMSQEAKTIIEMTDSLRAFQEDQLRSIAEAAEAGYFDQLTQSALVFRRQLTEVFSTIRIVAFEILKPSFVAIGKAFGVPGTDDGITGWADKVREWVNKPETKQAIQQAGEQLAHIVTSILPETTNVFGFLYDKVTRMAQWIGILNESGQVNVRFFSDIQDSLSLFAATLLDVVASLMSVLRVFSRDIDGDSIQDIRDKSAILRYGSLEDRDNFQEIDQTIKKLHQAPAQMGDRSPIARRITEDVESIIEGFMEDKEINRQERKRLIEIMESNVVASRAVKDAIEKQTNISADQVEDLLRSNRRIEHHSKTTSEQVEVGFD